VCGLVRERFLQREGLLGSKVGAVSGISVVEFMSSSFLSLFFDGWSVVESDVDAKLLFAAYGCYKCCIAKNHIAAG
jgi:hypothetical protein